MEDESLARIVGIGVVVLAALVGLALVSGGPEPDVAPAVARRSGAAVIAPVDTTVAPAVTTVATTAAPTATTPPATTATPPAATAPTAAGADPGALPQTDERPSATGAAFDAGVQGLWQAVQQDRPELATPFFFPKSAYLQVKAIADPATDYEQRLVANYAQDIHTLHAQLGADAARAQFAGIDVPDSQVVLVQPGEESNRLPYWRVYGTTLRDTVDGQEHSFPVTSLISWRGQWYVVHLGEIR